MTKYPAELKSNLPMRQIPNHRIPFDKHICFILKEKKGKRKVLWCMMLLEVKNGNQSLFVFVHSECFGYATFVEKNTQCSLWVCSFRRIQKRISDPRFARFLGRKEREIRNWICNLGNLSPTRAICTTASQKMTCFVLFDKLCIPCRI